MPVSAYGHRSVADAKYAAMSCMSCSLSDAACACIVLWPRCPDLYAFSAMTMYSGCCPPHPRHRVVGVSVVVAGNPVATHAGDCLHPSLRGISVRVRGRRGRERNARHRGADQHRAFHPSPVPMASRRVPASRPRAIRLSSAVVARERGAVYPLEVGSPTIATPERAARRRRDRATACNLPGRIGTMRRPVDTESGMAETRDARAASPDATSTNFIRQAIDADVAAGRVPHAVVTRFHRNPMATCISGTRSRFA